MELFIKMVTVVESQEIRIEIAKVITVFRITSNKILFRIYCYTFLVKKKCIVKQKSIIKITVIVAQKTA